MTTSAVGGATGCVAGLRGAAPPPHLAAAAAERIAALDHALSAIDHGSPLAAFAGKLPKDDIAREEGFLRAAMRSLTVAGTLRDLPDELQAHPTIQARVWETMPLMDHAVLGARDRLVALTPTERSKLTQAFAKDRDLEDRIFSEIDVAAAAGGVSIKRRLHLRALASEVCGRLRQSTDLFVQELDRKVESSIVRHRDSDHVERTLIATLGRDDFTAYKTRMATHHVAWTGLAQVPTTYGPTGAAPATTVIPSASTMPSANPGLVVTSSEMILLRDAAIIVSLPPTPDNNPARLAKPRAAPSTVLTIGGILLGIGALLFGICLAVIPSGGAGALFGATLGAMLAIAGLIVSIVGVVMYATR